MYDSNESIEGDEDFVGHYDIVSGDDGVELIGDDDDYSDEDDCLSVEGWSDFLKVAKRGIAIAQKGKSFAEKVARSKYVTKALKSNLLKNVVSLYPGGAVAWKLANKAHGVLAKAKAGDQTSKAKIAAIAELAKQGDPVAAQTARTMAVMSQALNLKAIKERSGRGTSLYQRGVTAMSGDTSDEMETAVIGVVMGWNPFSSIKKAAKKVASHVKHMSNPLNAAKFALKWSPTGVAYRLARGAVRKARGKSAAAIPAMSSASAAPLEDYGPGSATDDGGGEYADEGGEEYTEEEASGWLYNRPYRTGTQHLLSLQRSPGASFSLRELYNLGLNRPGTSISSLARGALNL